MLTIQFYIEQFFMLLFFPIVAIGRWLKERQHARFQQQLLLAQIQADAQKAVLVEFADVMKVTMKETAEASKEQAKILHEWLAGFKTMDMPRATIVTDADEAQRERDQLRAMGFPVDLSGREQLEWLTREMEKE